LNYYAGIYDNTKKENLDDDFDWNIINEFEFPKKN